MKFLKLTVFPLKPRISRTDLVSLELSYRAKGMPEMCALGWTFLFQSGVIPYYPKLGDNCL